MINVEKRGVSPCHDHDYVWGATVPEHTEPDAVLGVTFIPEMRRRICRRCGRVEVITDNAPETAEAYDVLYERFHDE